MASCNHAANFNIQFVAIFVDDIVDSRCDRETMLGVSNCIMVSFSASNSEQQLFLECVKEQIGLRIIGLSICLVSSTRLRICGSVHSCFKQREANDISVATLSFQILPRERIAWYHKQRRVVIRPLSTPPFDENETIIVSHNALKETVTICGCTSYIIIQCIIADES